MKTCYEATHGVDSAFENTCSACGNSSLLLNNALLALGKVPGPEAESASREDASFSRVFGEEASRRAGRGKDGLSKQSYAS